MNRKKIIVFGLAALSLAIIYFSWPTDESRIKKVFRDGAKAVEERKPEELMAKISFNYSDDHGLSYLLLKKNIEKILPELSNITVEYEIETLEIKGDGATAAVDVKVIATHGNDTGYFIGDAAHPEHITFLLQKERTRWLIAGTRGLRSLVTTRS